jgi:hypothetical protein
MNSDHLNASWTGYLADLAFGALLIMKLNCTPPALRMGLRQLSVANSATQWTC